MADPEVTGRDGARRTIVASPVVDATYAAEAPSVGAARASVRAWLQTLAADELMSGDVELALSEACTNVVVHGYRSGDRGCFRVVAQSVGDDVQVTVSDEGCGMTPRADSPGLGLGLPLMAALTDSLEVRPAAGGAGTVVCMQFSAAGAHARSAIPG